MIPAITAVFSICFLALKVNHTVDWSWWAVFAPMLILGGYVLLGYALLAWHTKIQAKHTKAVEAYTVAIQRQGVSDSPFASLAKAFAQLGQAVKDDDA
jgi:hypothetical protein